MLATIVLGTIIFALMGLVVIKQVKKSKQGGCGCSGCSGCSSAAKSCHSGIKIQRWVLNKNNIYIKVIHEFIEIVLSTFYLSKYKITVVLIVNRTIGFYNYIN